MTWSDMESSLPQNGMHRNSRNPLSPHDGRGVQCMQYATHDMMEWIIGVGEHALRGFHSKLAE